MRWPSKEQKPEPMRINRRPRNEEVMVMGAIVDSMIFKAQFSTNRVEFDEDGRTLYTQTVCCVESVVQEGNDCQKPKVSIEERAVHGQKWNTLQGSAGFRITTTNQSAPGKRTHALEREKYCHTSHGKKHCFGKQHVSEDHIENAVIGQRKTSAMQ